MQSNLLLNTMTERDPKDCQKADIVLLGISRTSKTPLSQYLAHKSYKVMNIQ